EFQTRVKLQSVTDGSTLTRAGQGLVYAGYSWRGRSKASSPAGAAPDDLSKEMRETLWISPDQLWAEGRWFFGEYQEFGVDVKLRSPTWAAMSTLKVLSSLKPSRISAAPTASYTPPMTSNSAPSTSPGRWRNIFPYMATMTRTS